MPVPTQCSWIIKKILGAKSYIQEDNTWLSQPKCSTKALYNTLRGRLQKVEWSNMICHNRAPPKYIFISWLMMHGRMATCDYLERVGIMVDNQCCLCERDEETLDHLFFECSVSGQIWQRVTDWCGIQRQPTSWRNEKDYLVRQCRTKSGRQGLYRCVVSIIVYELWKERNARRMKSCKAELEAVIQKCKGMIAWCCRRDPKLTRALHANQNV